VKRTILMSGVAMAALAAANVAHAGAHASTEDQLKAQAAMIDALSKEVEALKAGVDSGGRIEKGVGGVNLKISGQVNRAVLFAADANDDSFFNFVDNDSSSTRVRWDADARTSNGLTVGTRLEVQLESNTAFGIDGNGQNPANDPTDDLFDLRHAYVFVKGGFGILTTGQQGEATEGILHQAFNYATLAEIHPEMVAGVFDGNSGVAGANLLFFGDGGRQDSIRYDTPSFGGARAAVSVRDNGEVTAAAIYAGKIAGLGVRGGFGYEENFGNQNLAFSGGINFGIVALNGAMAVQLNENNAEETDVFYWISLAHRGAYTDLGPTSLGIDWYNSNGVDTVAGGANNNAIGLGLVQEVAPGAEFYAGVRHHFGGDAEDSAQVVQSGMRIKF
jgi:hypothetical protein